MPCHVCGMPCVQAMPAQCASLEAPVQLPGVLQCVRQAGERARTCACAARRRQQQPTAQLPVCSVASAAAAPPCQLLPVCLGCLRVACSWCLAAWAGPGKTLARSSGAEAAGLARGMWCVRQQRRRCHHSFTAAHQALSFDLSVCKLASGQEQVVGRLWHH